MLQQEKSKTGIKPINPQKVRESIDAGRNICNQPNSTKMAAAMKMFEMIRDESREVVVKAFIDGAGLTEKGAMTYYYNCRRKHQSS